MESIPPARDATDLYLDLLKGCLTRSLFLDEQRRRLSSTNSAAELQLEGWRAGAWDRFRSAVNLVWKDRGWTVELSAPVDATRLVEGRARHAYAETMIGHARLDNIQECVTSILEDNIPGDLIEAGVWRGGAAILMRAVLAAHGVSDRDVWLADSFEGLPAPNADEYPADAGKDLSGHPRLAVDVEQVKTSFSRYGLLDDRVRFLVGWFKDSLPAAPITQLALVRLDGDLYESTMDAITALYPKLSVGGYLIIDDYNAPMWSHACGQAIRDYRAAHDIIEPIREIDWTGAYWRRER